ncbi:MAG: hypothetical protein KHX55_00410 [Proteobacteria bacterium]|nr:hypothetical protein [Pseudomonadota bacterium]
MFKSLFRFIRFIIIGFLWSYLFIVCANFLMFGLWNFNILSARSWQTISAFWQSGGVIKTGKDYVFLSMLFALPLIWIWGWRYFSRLSYADIFLWPVNAYNRRIIRKYGHNSSRIVLKNMKSSQRIIDDIKNELESIKPEKAKEVQNIRRQINDVISSEIKNG